MFDGFQELDESGWAYFAEERDSWRHPPIFRHAWLTRENINETIAREGFVGPIDLHSVEDDGIDYYLQRRSVSLNQGLSFVKRIMSS